MRLSKPLPARLENGVFAGSAQNTSGLGSALMAMGHNESRTHATLRKREHIQHASLRRSGWEIAHGSNKSQRCCGVALSEAAGHDRTGPSADARKHRHVFLLLRTAIDNGLADDARTCFELPELFPGARVHRFEPTVESAEEHEVARGGHRAA